MATAADVLRGGYELLVEKGWSKGAFARDENGVTCRPADPTAASFCSLGACFRASVDRNKKNSLGQVACYETAVRILEEQVRKETSVVTGGKFMSISHWNDESDWRDIERGWLCAIAVAEEHYETEVRVERHA